MKGIVLSRIVVKGEVVLRWMVLATGVCFGEAESNSGLVTSFVAASSRNDVAFDCDARFGLSPSIVALWLAGAPIGCLHHLTPGPSPQGEG